MKTNQPAHRLSFAAAVAVAAGLLTGALWSTQPATSDVAVLQQQMQVDRSIPSITITAKRLTKAEKARVAQEAIDPAVPHLTVIGYRDHKLAALVRSL